MAKPRRKIPILDGERIRLRAFRAGDAKALHAIYGDPDHMRFWGTDGSPSLAATRGMMRWHVTAQPRHYTIWAIEEKKSRRLVGMINYHRRDLRERRVDMGWAVLPQLQGKGYMTEAGRTLLHHLFDTLKVHKVEALIRRENKPSAALARRLGFRLEASSIRDRWLVAGKWHSVMLFGLIAGEEK
jgi:RimJ/RimL family protein N-acetyltransferase